MTYEIDYCSLFLSFHDVVISITKWWRSDIDQIFFLSPNVFKSISKNVDVWVDDIHTCAKIAWESISVGFGVLRVHITKVYDVKFIHRPPTIIRKRMFVWYAVMHLYFNTDCRWSWFYRCLFTKEYRLLCTQHHLLRIKHCLFRKDNRFANIYVGYVPDH
jgi:hypothetical protein